MRRIGLVGFGKIAEHGHLPAWQSLGCEVVAVADLSPAGRERARELLPVADLFQAPLDLIQTADIDVVDICTPPGTHADLIQAACRRGGLDVVSEKPLVLGEDEYLAVARARRESSGRVVSVNNWMHSELFRYVSSLLTDGAVGEVQRIELRTGRPDNALGSEGWMPAWRLDLAHSGGGVVLDHGWHQLYMLLGWLRAPVESVRATARTVDARHAPVEDEATIELTFPGASGLIELSWVASERTNGGRILGTSGEVLIQDDGLDIRSGAGTRSVRFKERLTQSSYHPDWFRATFESGILSPSPDEAMRNFAEAGTLISIIRAAYRSARTGTSEVPTDLAGQAVQDVKPIYVHGSRNSSTAQ